MTTPCRFIIDTSDPSPLVWHLIYASGTLQNQQKHVDKYLYQLFLYPLYGNQGQKGPDGREQNLIISDLKKVKFIQRKGRGESDS